MTPDLRASYEQCLRRYPAVNIALEDYIARMQQVLTAPCGPARIHYEDLFLAFACSRGDRVAWEHFADEYLPQVRRWASQACHQLADGEDLSQEIAMNLLAHRDKLAGYDGRGSLAAWLRVAVSRAAIDRFRKGRRQVSLEEMQEQGSPSAEPAETARVEQQIDARWGRVLIEQLSGDLARLPTRDRLLVGFYYVEQLPLRTIAHHFGVHESTASRWLEGVRDSLRRRVEREMRRRFGLRARELETLWRYAAEEEGSQLEAALKESPQAVGRGPGDK